MTNLKSFSPREAYAAYMLGSVFVDVRENVGTDAKKMDVRQIITLPFSELDTRFGELPVNRPVVLVSKVGNKGKQAARFLLEHGYTDVAIIDGGMTAWEQEGLPVR